MDVDLRIRNTKFESQLCYLLAVGLSSVFLPGNGRQFSTYLEDLRRIK